ncbi:MAG TPA: DUF4124 domain-containing protein [Nevskia sp.]|nr:DUF4124 domain-containing protein [Nevskia sp.]
MNKSLLSLLLCGLPLAASAQIYKWTDANGQVHFSQNPPKQGSYQDVTPQGPISGTSTDSNGRPLPPPPRSGGGSSSGSAPATQAMRAGADNAERCAKANERIAYLQEKTAHRLMVTGDDGQPARMTDEQFDQQLKDARDAAAKYCGS